MSELKYNVAPRYTAGSPAMVDRAIAERVAEQEEEAFHRSLTGIYGEEARTIAQTQGLGWIAWETMERRSQLTKADMLTGQITVQKIDRHGRLSAPVTIQEAM
jgi:nicotinamide mononucleotide (NMN) deamidase PncC